jgi:shikimate kinase
VEGWIADCGLRIWDCGFGERGERERVVRVILMGLRGAGKTTVGKGVAARRRVWFVDLDDVTRGDLGCATVVEAWERYGEARFRRAEVEGLKRVLKGEAGVIGLGGGTPTSAGAAELLRGCLERGDLVVYLRAQPGALRERLRGQMGDRPSLTGGDPLEEIGIVFERRDELYRAFANAVIETDGMSVERVVDRVCELVDADGPSRA